MSREPRVTTQKRRNEMFRYGQLFDNSKIQFMIDRTPYAYRLTYGVVKDAIGKGIQTIDKETEEPKDWSPDMWQVLKTEWKTIEKYFGFERAYGKALFFISEDKVDGVVTEDSKPRLRAFNPLNYSVEYSEQYEITKVMATEYISGSAATTISHELEGDELKSVFELILRENDRKGEGKSVLMKVWDTLFSLMMLDEHATYFVIRVGGGLKIIKVPEDKLNDTKYMAKIRNAVEGVNSGNGVMIIPTVNVGGVTTQDLTFELLSGDQIDFVTIRDLLLGSMSAGTGYPRESWLGSELGLRSSETNQGNFFAFIQDIQDDCRPFLEWLIRQLNIKHQWFTDENEEFEILYTPRSEMTEMQKLELWNIKGDILSKFQGKIDDTELAAIIGVKKILEKEMPVIFGEPGQEDNEEEEEPEVEEVEDDE